MATTDPGNGGPRRRGGGRREETRPGDGGGASSTRREFLRRGGGLTAALAFPAIWPAGVVARPGRPGPADTVVVGYIGVGRRAGGLFGLPPGVRIAGVADVNRPRAERVGRAKECPAYTDYRRLLERKEIDGILVATPDHWHTLPSLHALQAGKDVYCEKPLTLTIREGRILVIATRKYKRVFQTGSQQRTMPPNILGCRLIREGKLGKVHEVLAANFASPWECAFPGEPVPEGLDWDRWCGQAEFHPYHKDIYTPRANPGWISFRPWSGGEMTGWGAHGLDQVQWALGMDGSGPVEIWTEGPRFDPPTYTEPAPRGPGERVCQQPIVHFRYANGTVVRLEGGPGGGAIFLGERGKIIIDRNRLTSDPPELAREPEKESNLRRTITNHLQDWIECIKSRKRPAADVEIGHRSCTVCHLGNIARWHGKRLVWDPAKEFFPHDREANEYLDRPRRKAYELPSPSSV